MNKHRITLLDFYIGISIIVVSNLLPSVDNGPFATEAVEEIYPVKATVLKIAWWTFIICGGVRLAIVLKNLIVHFRKVIND